MGEAGEAPARCRLPTNRIRVFVVVIGPHRKKPTAAPSRPIHRAHRRPSWNWSLHYFQGLPPPIRGS